MRLCVSRLCEAQLKTLKHNFWTGNFSHEWKFTLSTKSKYIQLMPLKSRNLECWNICNITSYYLRTVHYTSKPTPIMMEVQTTVDPASRSGNVFKYGVSPNTSITVWCKLGPTTRSTVCDRVLPATPTMHPLMSMSSQLVKNATSSHHLYSQTNKVYLLWYDHNKY